MAPTAEFDLCEFGGVLQGDEGGVPRRAAQVQVDFDPVGPLDVESCWALGSVVGGLRIGGEEQEREVRFWGARRYMRAPSPGRSSEGRGEVIDFRGGGF